MRKIDELINSVRLTGPSIQDAKPSDEDSPARRGDTSICPICHGTGWLREERPLEHQYFGRALMCDCLISRIEKQELEELQKLSNLEPFADKTFDNFDPKVSMATTEPNTILRRHGLDNEARGAAQVVSVEKAYQVARQFANDPRGWLVLTGPIGCGKTHLAAAIANHALANQARVLFAVVPDLLDHIRATFMPSSTVTYDSRFEAVRTTFLLILDDLGAQYSSPWAQEKLYQIFNHRYNYELPTVVTTNVPFDKLDPDKFDSRISSRMIDAALCKILVINARDYRPKQAGERRFRKAR